MKRSRKIEVVFEVTSKLLLLEFKLIKALTLTSAMQGSRPRPSSSIRPFAGFLRSLRTSNRPPRGDPSPLDGSDPLCCRSAASQDEPTRTEANTHAARELDFVYGGQRGEVGVPELLSRAQWPRE